MLDGYNHLSTYLHLVCIMQLQQVEAERDLLRKQKEEASMRVESLQDDLDRARGQVSQVLTMFHFSLYVFEIGHSNAKNENFQSLIVEKSDVFYCI